MCILFIYLHSQTNHSIAIGPSTLAIQVQLIWSLPAHLNKGDCKGGNKTGGLVHSSAAYIYMNETIEKIQTQWMCLGHYVEQNTNRE